MTEQLNELEAFWDDFAVEYEEIQQESDFPIAEDLRAFLLKEKMLPCQTFLDLAGGTGRYLSHLQNAVENYDLVDISEKMLEIAKTKANENVRLIKADQTSFLQQVKQRYDIVFSAMNPALQSKADILAFCQASRHWCLILRVVRDEDQLFSPYEEKNPDLLLNKRYKTFLQEEKITFKIKQFSYQKTEKISKAFFREYFEDDFTASELVKMLEKHFGNQQEMDNQQFLDFELIYFHVPKAYNENGF